jgi:hypothetical protein
VKRFLPLLMLALALSSCTIRFDMGVDVKEDESGTFTVFVGLDQEMRDLIAQSGGEDTNIVDQMTQQVPEGFKVEEYSEDGFEGAKISGSFSSFDDLNQRLTQAGGDQASALGGDVVNSFQFTHEGDEFHFTADVSSLGQDLTTTLGDAGSSDLPSGFDTSMLSDLFDMRFRLTLPGEIKDNNADSVNGNTLTWNLALDEQRDALEATSSTAGGSSALLIGGIAVIAALLLGGGVAMSRRRKQASVEAVESTPASPIS